MNRRAPGGYVENCTHGYHDQIYYLFLFLTQRSARAREAAIENVSQPSGYAFLVFHLFLDRGR